MPNNTDAAIFTLLDQYNSAVYAKDAKEFLALYDQDVRVFDLWVDWSYEGRDAWSKVVTHWFGDLNTDRDVVTFSDVKTVVSGDMAVVHAFIRFTAVSAEGKELRTMLERLTWTLVKKSGEWKIAHQHTSAPVDFRTMKAILER